MHARIAYRTYVLSIFAGLTLSNAFLWSAPPLVRPRQQPVMRRPSKPTFPLHLNSDQEKEEMDAMRKLLEQSWNIKTMGQVPTNPIAAAEAAFASLTTALAASVTRSNTGSQPRRIFNIDILLPQYDIRQGPRVYDEVLAVEFCIQLAQQQQTDTNEGPTLILVRDDSIVATVDRVLSAREREREQMARRLNEEEDEEDDTDNDEPVDDSCGSAESPASVSDIESFRQQLITGWTDPTENDDRGSTDTIEPTSIPNESIAVDETSLSPTTPVYRLASLLGSAILPSGSNQAAAVRQAVQTHAEPFTEEGTIIILSAIDSAQMVAVRNFVQQHGDGKTILLVNCQLTPTPRELFFAETVYSLTPFVVRPRVGASAEEFAPKVVVLRRYPSDWEVSWMRMAMGLSWQASLLQNG